MPEAVRHYLPYIVIFNFAVVSAILIILGLAVGRRELKEVPEGAQNVAEFVLDWFVGQARKMSPGRVTIIAPFLATFFMLILGSNLLSLLPLPIIRIPPTSYYSGPLALALASITGIIVISCIHKGIFGSVKHLFWPNPLQIVTELSDILSLSLRLYGNIGGEFIVALLVVQTAPYGIPLVIHALGLIPAFIQALVFTLLTSNFLASAIHHEERRGRKAAKAGKSKEPAPETPLSGESVVTTAT